MTGQIASSASRVEQRPEFPVLDTLRAAGALAVLTTHVTFVSGDYTRHGIVGSMFSRLDIGVAIFFVLSGFLLSRPYLARHAVSSPPPALGRYYWKRFIRVYPVYAVSAVLALIIIAANRHDAGPLVWLRTLTLTDTFVGDRLPDGLTQMWSLAVEVTFYLFLPLIMRLLLPRDSVLRTGRVAALLVLGTVFCVWWNAGLATAVEPFVSGTPTLWLPAHLSWFIVGIALALAHVVHQQGSAARPVRALAAIGAMPGVCWAAAAGIFLVAATPLGGPTTLLVATPTQSVTKNVLYAVVAGLVVASGVYASRGRFSAVMSTPWLRHLGRISYSVFCIHQVIIYLVRVLLHHQLFTGRGPLIWILTLVLSLAASEVLYRWVERPSLRLKRVDASRGAVVHALRRRNGDENSPTTTTTTRY